MTRSTPRCLTPLLLWPLLAATFFISGCVERKLSITSFPSGALVTMNDQEVGRTPIETDFVYYGKYDVQVRKDGYQTINKPVQLHAPWWQYVPIDFFAEFMPWHPTDHKHINFNLKPLDVNKISTTTLLDRAAELKTQLESPPSTQSTTQPATQPSTQPTTQPTTQPATLPVVHPRK